MPIYFTELNEWQLKLISCVGTINSIDKKSSQNQIILLIHIYVNITVYIIRKTFTLDMIMKDQDVI